MKRWWAAVPVALAILINVVPLTSFFNSDDFGLLQAVRLHGPFGIWSGHGQPFFRPLVSASVWLDTRIWGLDPFGFHLKNVTLHAVNAGLVYILAALLLRRMNKEPGFLPLVAATFFALMPCHAEAVAWVSGRTDVLSTTLALAACVAFLREGKWPRLAAAGLFFLALLAKESPLLLPLAVALLVVAVDNVTSRRRRDALLALSGVGIVALYLLLRVLVIGQLVGGYGTSSYFGVGFGGLFKNAALYAAKAVAPGSSQQLSQTSLGSFLAARPETSLVPFTLLVLGAAGLGAMLAVGTRTVLRDWGRLILGSLAAFFLLALPSLPLGMNAYTAEGSRFLYLPSVGLCLAATATLSLMKPWIGRIVAVCVCIAYGWGLWDQNQAWHVAGDDARRSILALRDLPPNAPLLTVPDSYRGCYVLRNCLREGLELFGVPRQLRILSGYSYEQPNQAPRMAAAGDVTEVRCAGTMGNLITLGPDAMDPASQILRFSPSRVVVRSPSGVALTPSGLIFPSP